MFSRIETILGENYNSKELARLLASGEFDAIVNELGITDIFAEYVESLDELAVNMSYADTQNAALDLEIMKRSEFDMLLGKAQSNIQYFKNKLLYSLYQENGSKDILDQLRNIPLTDTQLKTVVSTGYTEFSRTATAMAFEDDSEQRFKYVGGLNLKTGSEECNWLLQNQKKDGYTRAEIDKGIETPFVYKSGSLMGQKKKIYWNGRVPNYNCDDRWLPI